MKDLKTALIASTCIIFVSIAGIAVYSVRVYLPLVGVLLLVTLSVGVLLAVGYAVLHLHAKFSKYEHTAISQYGSILTRRNQLIEIAPHYPESRQRIASPASVVIEADELDDMPALMPAMLSFSQLLERGIIQSALNDGQMLLGYVAATQTLRYGSWLDLYSCGNGGVSGSGKSTTTRFLLFQAILANAKLIMIDPHIGDPDESLAFQFSQLPASIHQIKPADGSDSNVEKRVTWLSKEIMNRKKHGTKTPFLVFVIDEFNSVMRHASKETRLALAKLLLDIEQEGRKFGIFAMLIGQRWSAQDLGGADIRTSLSSKMGHRFSDEDQAVRFIGSKHGKSLLELETGHWLFYDTTGKTVEMITPETLANDGASIAKLLETSAKPAERSVILTERTTGEIACFEGETSAESSELLPLARRIMQMQASGSQKADIMRAVWGVSPGANEAYRNAQEQYQLVMQFIASEIGA